MRVVIPTSRRPERANERGEGPLVERRKHWPPIGRRVHELLIAPERRDHWIGKARRIPLLFLAIDVHAPVLEVHLFPADAPSTRVVWITQELADPNGSESFNEII